MLQRFFILIIQILKEAIMENKAIRITVFQIVPVYVNSVEILIEAKIPEIT